mgnify:CR=1 FL=1
MCRFARTNSGYASHDRIGGRAIDYGCVGQFQFCDLACEDARGSIRRREAASFSRQRAEIDAAAIEHKAFAIRQTNHRDVESAGEEIRSLLMQLAEKRSTNIAGANDEKRKAFTPLEESTDG